MALQSQASYLECGLTTQRRCGVGAWPWAAAALAAAGVASFTAFLIMVRRQQRKLCSSMESRSIKSSKELLEEVGRKSKSVMYIVSNSSNTDFSAAGLAKYLRMKGVEPRTGDDPEAVNAENAGLLLELLDQAIPTATIHPLRHELVKGAVWPAQIRSLFPDMKAAYVQQVLDYGPNSRYGDRWRISCYLVVMENWKPKIEPHAPMVKCMSGVMDECVQAFSRWYRKRKALSAIDVSVMNAFVTRYRPMPDEDQLKKHIDGANVDGSVVLALSTDDPFEGGALHVWDGRPEKEFKYRMSPGDALFLENAVWHQSMPITSGTRWALVLFLRLRGAIPKETQAAP